MMANQSDDKVGRAKNIVCAIMMTAFLGFIVWAYLAERLDRQIVNTEVVYVLGVARHYNHSELGFNGEDVELEIRDGRPLDLPTGLAPDKKADKTFKKGYYTLKIQGSGRIWDRQVLQIIKRP